MARLTPGANTGRLASRFGRGTDPESLRKSESRRQLLERWGRIIAGSELSLYLNPSHGETAFVRLKADVPHIEIPSWEIPQEVTSYPRVAFDMLMQRTLTLHEVGHVKYTDQTAVDDVVSQVAPERREQFHEIWNALEDGAIEEQLRREFSVADELETMNANFSESGAGDVEHSLFDATMLAALDFAVYDSGRLGSVLDPDDESRTLSDSSDRATLVEEIVPAVKSAAVDVVSEPDPETRAERILNLWEQIADLFDPSTESKVEYGKGNHADQDNGPGAPAPDIGDLDPSDLESFMDDIAADGDASNGGPGHQNGSNTDPSGSMDGGDSTDSSDAGSDTEASGADTGGDESDILGGGPADAADSSEPEDPEDSGTEAGSTEQPDGPENGGRGEEPDGGGRKDGSVGGDDGPSQDDGPQSGQEQQVDAADRPSAAGTDSADTSDSDEPSGSPSEQAENGSPDSSRGSGSAGKGSDETRLARDEDTVGTDRDVVEEYERLAEEQRDADEAFTEDLREELDRLEESLTQLSADVRRPSLELATDQEVRGGVWTNVQEEGRKLRRILERKLQEEKRSRTRRGLRHGRIDPRALPRIHQSDPRVFRAEEKPDQKEYAVVLVMDRSGSMGDDVLAAEKACLSLATALEELSIDTCILDICGGNQRLAKPFGVDPQDSLPKLITGETGGTTPLTGALQIARERLRQREEFPFVVVVTDGRPDNPESYRSALSECRFPVLGVYLQFGARSALPSEVDQSASLFDRRRIVTDESRLSDELRGLCQEVMF